jgi:hypothetical protein
MQRTHWFSMLCVVGVKGASRFDSGIKENLVKAVKLGAGSAF